MIAYKDELGDNYGLIKTPMEVRKGSLDYSGLQVNSPKIDHTMSTKMISKNKITENSNSV